MEFDAAFTTFEGEPYHNQYCLVITVRGWQDRRGPRTRRYHYGLRGVHGNRRQHAGVMDRLKRLERGVR